MERSTVLEPAEEQLLIAMMGLLATVWAIGVAVYEFIYQYWEKNYRVPAETMAKQIKLKEPVDPKAKDEMRRGLRRNMFVFSGYVVAGVLSAFMVASGTVALVESSRTWRDVAVQLFGFALATQFALFTWEILTSIKQVGGLWLKIRKRG